jgi:hypothetical protein
VTDLLHEAFTYARQAYDLPTHAVQRWQFENAHPEVAAGVTDAAYDRAVELWRVAWELAERVRDNKSDGAAAFRELESRCPGFSNATYSDAFGQAMYESMW